MRIKICYSIKAAYQIYFFNDRCLLLAYSFNLLNFLSFNILYFYLAYFLNKLSTVKFSANVAATPVILRGILVARKQRWHPLMNSWWYLKGILYCVRKMCHNQRWVISFNKNGEKMAMSDNNFFQSLDPEFFKESIGDLLNRWRKIIVNSGNNFD